MLVGIEITPVAVRATALARAGRREPPAAAVEQPLHLRLGDDRASDALASALDTALKQLPGAKPAPVAVALPSEWCVYRHASFPFRSPSRVHGTLSYSLESRLPGRVEDYVIEPAGDLRPAGERGGRVLVAACERRSVRLALDALRQAGHDPALLQPAPVSLAAYLHLMSPGRRGRTALLARLDGASVELVLARDREILACQSLPLAPGESDDEHVARNVRLIVRAWTLAGGEGSLDHALLLAPADRVPSLAAALGAQLERPVQSLPAEPDAEKWAAACGAAAALHRDGAEAVSFRRGEFAYPPFRRARDRKVGALLAAGLLVAALFGGRMAAMLADERQRADQLRQEEGRVFHQVIPNRAIAPHTAILDGKVAEVREEARRFDADRRRSAVRVWVEIANCVPAAMHANLSVIDISPAGVRLEGKAKSAAQIWELRDQIASSKVFSPNVPTSTQDPKSGETSFAMELRYRP